jgi:hypothetical protein
MACAEGDLSEAKQLLKESEDMNVVLDVINVLISTFYFKYFLPFEFELLLTI